MPQRDWRQLIKGFLAWDAEGNRAFLQTMQEKLPGFDSAAVIEASGMLHGFKQVWPPAVTTAEGPS
jgi:hypothetical protein